MDVETLVATARDAQQRAIAPYSGYEVGAAIATTDGSQFGGCNLEVANYSNSLHAECIALARALFEGHRSFDAIAVTTADRSGAAPCGLCRQTLLEYCDPSLKVYADLGPDVDEYELGELLPAAFTGEELDRAD
jgi:cytidine deaminase